VTQTYKARALLKRVRSINQAGSYNQWYAPNLDYNAAGQVSLLRLGNPLTTTYTYDALTFRLKRLQTSALLDLNYAYDPVGNITRITDTLNSGQVITFSYDALDRLVGAKTTLAGTGSIPTPMPTTRAAT